MKQSMSGSELNGEFSLWLKQFTAVDVLIKLIELIDFNAVYIVDREYRVLLWSNGLEKLSGLNQLSILGQQCPPEYHIDQSQQKTIKEIQLVHPDGDSFEVKLYTQALYRKDGAFAGGIGFLLPDLEHPPRYLMSTLPVAEEKNNFHGILSRAPAMQPVFQIIQNAAKTEATVLVRGESGSGKELVARAIHDLSPRRNEPFLAINCAALSINLLESELFGHVRGAFSGAIKDHTGVFQRAHSGTLFLDEVAELPMELQAKLLRVIQERNFIPVGGDKTYDVDVRIVAATHRSLREEVKAGRFREDLMYRLRVVPIFIPALRERREDISLLLWHFINQHNKSGFRRIEKIDPQAMKVLLDYRWPGNVRELQNVVEYAFAVGSGVSMRLSELPPEFREPFLSSESPPLDTPLSAAEEMATIRQALVQSNGKVTQAARLVGMSRATFWRKRKLYEI